MNEPKPRGILWGDDSWRSGTINNQPPAESPQQQPDSEDSSPESPEKPEDENELPF